MFVCNTVRSVKKIDKKDVVIQGVDKVSEKKVIEVIEENKFKKIIIELYDRFFFNIKLKGNYPVKGKDNLKDPNISLEFGSKSDKYNINLEFALLKNLQFYLYILSEKVGITLCSPKKLPEFPIKYKNLSSLAFDSINTEPIYAAKSISAGITFYSVVDISVFLSKTFGILLIEKQFKNFFVSAICGTEFSPKFYIAKFNCLLFEAAFINFIWNKNDKNESIKNINISIGILDVALVFLKKPFLSELLQLFQPILALQKNSDNYLAGLSIKVGPFWIKFFWNSKSGNFDIYIQVDYKYKITKNDIFLNNAI